MRITIVAVGRLKDGGESDLVQRYLERLQNTATVREVEERRSLSAPELKRREGALLLDACPAKATIVALDERGKMLKSRAFATKLQDMADDGVPELVFLIGGADGLDEAVLDRADWKLSLGELTWPHQLARAMLMEQIYRAQQISAGHPYHRD